MGGGRWVLVVMCAQDMGNDHTIDEVMDVNMLFLLLGLRGGWEGGQSEVYGADHEEDAEEANED